MTTGRTLICGSPDSQGKSLFFCPIERYRLIPPRFQYSLSGLRFNFDFRLNHFSSEADCCVARSVNNTGYRLTIFNKSSLAQNLFLGILVESALNSICLVFGLVVVTDFQD